jgi:hypothetical protein
MAHLILFLTLLSLAPDAHAVPVVIAAVAAAASVAITSGFAALATMAFVKAFAINLAISAFTGVLNKFSGKKSEPSYAAEAQDRLQTVRSSIETRRVVYGQVLTSGPLVYAESTGSTNEYLHMVIPLAGHECEEIGDVYFNDELVGTLDGSGNVTSGRFSGYARIKKHLGTAAQTADADLVAESASLWTTDHRLRGICYVYVRLLWSQNVFPNGIPSVRALVKGKKLYDPRTGLTVWSDNWGLCVRDYLAADYGLECSSAEIDDTALTAAANISDEDVDLDAGGTTTQKRYTCNGTVTLADRPLDIMRQLLSAGAGACVYTQGLYRVFAGAYVTPAISIDESWLSGGVSVSPRRPRRELYNGVRGTYSDPAKGWQPTDFPPVTNATYETQDGGQQIIRDIELPFTTNVTRAQRIARIHLEKSRQGITVELSCNLKAFKVAVWDTVQLTLERFGFSSKVFLVTGWEFNESGGITLTLQEEASAVYDWLWNNAAGLDAAPDTVLPSPFSGLTISGLTATSGTAQLLLQGDGTVVPRIQLQWSAPTSPYIKHYEMQFASTADTPREWRDVPPVLAPAETGFLMPVNDGGEYDCQIRAVTVIGNAGAWAQVLAHTVIGKTARPSDVTGASAVQQGGLVVMGCNPVSDADLDSIEVRVHDEGETNYDDASPLGNILRGETVTSAALPPGTWELLFKAKDTSGNYSLNAAQATITVTSEGYTTISSVAQAPAWGGTLTNMVRHYTGVIVPESQDLASALGWEVFDEFVHNAYADCYYEAAAVDKAIDAPARIYGDIVSVLGPGETGLAAPRLEIDYKLNADSYDGFEVWTVGAANFRQMKARIHVETAVGKPVISQFTPTIDGLARTETGTLAIGGGGSAAGSFATTFHNTPVLTVSPQGSGNVSASWDGLTTSGFTGYFKSAGVAAAGTLSYSATGV